MEVDQAEAFVEAVQFSVGLPPTQQYIDFKDITRLNQPELILLPDVTGSGPKALPV